MIWPTYSSEDPQTERNCAKRKFKSKLMVKGLGYLHVSSRRYAGTILKQPGHKDRVYCKFAATSSQDQISPCPHPGLLWATPAANHFHLTSPKTKIIQKVSVFWMDNDVSYKFRVQISIYGSKLGHQKHFKEMWFLILGSILLSLSHISLECYPTSDKCHTKTQSKLCHLTSICLLLSLLFLVVVDLPAVSTKILIISLGWWQAQAQKILNKRLRQIHTVNHLWHMYSSTVFKTIYVRIFVYTVIIWLLFWNELYKSSSKPPNQTLLSAFCTPSKGETTRASPKDVISIGHCSISPLWK